MYNQNVPSSAQKSNVSLSTASSLISVTRNFYVPNCFLNQYISVIYDYELPFSNFRWTLITQLSAGMGSLPVIATNYLNHINGFLAKTLKPCFSHYDLHLKIILAILRNCCSSWRSAAQVQDFAPYSRISNRKLECLLVNALIWNGNAHPTQSEYTRFRLDQYRLPSNARIFRFIKLITGIDGVVHWSQFTRTITHGKPIIY